MAQSAVHLTQSRFYSPAFNAAVFDGPIRIYFAQHQEALALKVYFQLQQYLDDSYQVFRKSFKQHGQTVFLLLYPNQETFQSSFAENVPRNVAKAALGEDHILGVKGPLSDSGYEEVFLEIKAILQGLGLSAGRDPDIGAELI